MRREQQGTLGWDEILHSARAKQLNVADLMSMESLGQGVKKNEKAGRLLKEGVFIPEDFAKSDFNVNSFSDRDEAKLKGKSLNLANRNVATSRVANLLGMGSIVEQSTSAVVKDNKTNKRYKGALMSFARGKEAGKEAINVKDVSKTKKTYEEKDSYVYDMMTPSIQKEISSL